MSKAPISQDDNTLFEQEMKGVKPLRHEERITPCRPHPKRQTQTVADTSEYGFAERDFANDIAADEALFYCQTGLQHREQRRLKRGNVYIDAGLDLHGNTIAEASQRLDEFLQQGYASDFYCVHVIHGKGYRSANGRAALKSQVNSWLKDCPYVLAFCSSQARHGGTGAVYVLLRNRTK
jgi:DNA-nicking Smr family endonuclease